MVRYRLYIEGGGQADPLPEQTNRAAMVDSNAEAFRMGWRIFFDKAGVNGKILDIGVGGGQGEAFNLFSKQLASYAERAEAEPKPLLLVDSEEPVLAGHTVWQHLQTRVHNKFQQPTDADDESAYMMVQAMETWFMADQSALQDFFGSAFDLLIFQNLPPLECIPKDDALKILQQATQPCNRHYTKRKRRSSDLLARIDPDTVATACPHAKDLLDYLRSL